MVKAVIFAGPLYGFSSPIVYNEVVKINPLVFNKDVDPLTKDLTSQKAIDIALESLKEDPE